MTDLHFAHPAGPAATRLNELLAERARIAGQLRDAEHSATFASTEQAAAGDALADLERRRASGENVSDAARAKAERALAEARARATEPWEQRRAGLTAALRDADHAVQRHIAEHYDELAVELGDNAESAKSRCDAALEELVDAYHERERVAGHATRVLAIVLGPKPNTVAASRLEGVAREVEKVLMQGGERAPLSLREPVQAVPA